MFIFDSKMISLFSVSQKINDTFLSLSEIVEIFISRLLPKQNMISLKSNFSQRD